MISIGDLQYEGRNVEIGERALKKKNIGGPDHRRQYSAPPAAQTDAAKRYRGNRQEACAEERRSPDGARPPATTGIL